MFKRIAAITFIFLCASVAWMVLGATIFSRSYSTRSGLKGRVISTWGAPQVQKPPTAAYDEEITSATDTVADGKKVTRTTRETVSRALPLASTRVRVDLDLEHRRKGLLWYNTYKVAFAGAYTFRNDTASERLVTFGLPLPAAQAVYDSLSMTVDGVPVEVANRKNSAFGAARIAAGQTAHVEVSYRSQGLDSWRYSFGGEIAQARDFTLTATTNFKAVDFAENTLSPTGKRETPQGWELIWAYKNLVSGFEIGIAMPEKLQPGPLAGEISLFAPVSLFFFFFLMFILTTLRRIELHPMNYFFLAAAFFAFHLLLAYLVDHISIHAAFAICSAVSIFLVVTYLRLVTGTRFALVEAGLAQLVYLVLFSYAFFLKGFTGLAVTIGSVLTLFVVMQMTGRIRWAERFDRRPVEHAPV
jgi:inner membrane protein involved in colicin E2 resistance